MFNININDSNFLKGDYNIFHDTLFPTPLLYQTQIGNGYSYRSHPPITMSYVYDTRSCSNLNR